MLCRLFALMPYWSMLCVLVIAPRASGEIEANPASPPGAAAPSSDVRRTEARRIEVPEPKNIVSARVVYALHLSNPNETVDGHSHSDNLYGFAVGYERVLIPGWLNVDVSKPFLWGENRFDSPLDLMLIKPFVFSKKFELFFGAGATFNVRCFRRGI